MGKPKSQRSMPPNVAMASQKVIKTSPQKLNLVASLIRGKPVGEAARILTFCKRRVSNDVERVLSAAIANAEVNHGLDIDKLYVDEAYVGKSMVLNRFHVRGRGRVAAVKKHFSNLKITVIEKEFA